MALVSIQEAREHLRIDTLADDPWLNTWILIVEDAVRSWLKDEWRLYEKSGIVDSNGNPIPLVDSAGQGIVSPRVRGAILVELAMQYRFRDGDQAPAVPSHWGHGHVLCAGATSLLVAQRKATVV